MIEIKKLMLANAPVAAAPRFCDLLTMPDDL
jgi:hypothetical protein